MKKHWCMMEVGLGVGAGVGAVFWWAGLNDNNDEFASARMPRGADLW